MILTYVLFVLGIFFLIKGADFLVEGTSSLADKLGISKLVIGLTIVAFGTSMPELMVNIFASSGGQGDIAFGNIMGSNMANILLILGVTALITSVKVQSSTVWKEIPFSFLAAAVLFVFIGKTIIDGSTESVLLRSEGIILLLFLAIFLYYIFELSKKSKIPFDVEVEKLPNWKIWALILLGVAGLYFGGEWTVNGAVLIAKQFGLSELLISSTIIAIGTALPELAASVQAARKNQLDMAVGGVVGSNILNILWVLGITIIISPMSLPVSAIVDASLVLIATFLLFSFLFFGYRHYISRTKGIIFLIMYVIYLVFLFLRG